MRVLGFGTYDARRHPRVQILLDGLAAHGDEVAEVNRPMGFSTAERVDMMQRPWTAGRLVARLVRCWARLTWAGRRQVRRWDADAVMVGYLGQFDVVLARLLFPRRRIVLDNLIFAGDTAADRGAGAVSSKVRLLNGLDSVAQRCADVIVVDTVEHAGLVPLARRNRVVVVPVGAPDAWFAPTPAPRPAAALRVVFYGLFTPLQGAVTIARAAALLADRSDIEITMIGAGQDRADAQEAAGPAARIRWVDLVEPERLPALVAEHDVCLGIFGTGPKALRVVPNKVFQGAAAGCAIVTSDTAPQRRLLGEDAIFVPPGDPSALAATLRVLAGDPGRVLDLRRLAYRRADEAFRPDRAAAPLRAALVERARMNPRPRVARDPIVGPRASE